MYETRKKYTTWIKGTKPEAKVQNLNENIRKYETNHCFAVSRNNSKHFFSDFFQFRKTIETRRNSDRFRTVSYFAKLKKNAKLSTLIITLLRTWKSEPSFFWSAPVLGCLNLKVRKPNSDLIVKILYVISLERL